MDRLEQLKLKYQAALNLMPTLGVRLQNVHLENEKLFVRGAAPSQEVKNKVWDQIKLIDPKYADLTCDITVDPSLAPPAKTAAPPAAEVRTYSVQPGDTLSKVSKQFYGDANQYMKIFDANRDQLKDPNLIKVGQVLKIP
ncbi:MAG: LysM peptidoglycan-binding domain-containing protein [Bryobacteraceae bacterium]|nr:LysM peptidoglycan-binding domain-containing protein [Bryobacteraceae bacterium]